MLDFALDFRFYFYFSGDLKKIGVPVYRSTCHYGMGPTTSTVFQPWP
jgi:hypothetical protein